MISTTADKSGGAAKSPATRFDVARVRADFPILQQKINGQPLVYVDNAATAQKPQAVLDALDHYYKFDNANIHRGVHALSVRATSAYEAARGKAQRFINASRPEEIVFVRGATEAINLVAQTHARALLKPGEEVLVTTMEHHSNIVPWQILCEQTGAKLRVAPIDDRGALPVDEFKKLLSQRTKVVAVVHVSNSLGTINPVEEITRLAHEVGACVVVDGAQAAPHMKIDVAQLDCDFYAVSSHKMFGPTGVGVLYGKHEWLEAMPPYQGGGEMISSVTFEKTVYNRVPHKFEAGTPNIGGVVAYGAAIDYLEAIGMDAIAAYEHELLEYATVALAGVPGLKLIGTAPEKAAVVSFVMTQAHAHDVGTILDQCGVAVRTGHHCTQPVMDRFGIPATARASLAFYNTREDVDRLVAGLLQVAEVFG